LIRLFSSAEENADRKHSSRNPQGEEMISMKNAERVAYLYLSKVIKLKSVHRIVSLPRYRTVLEPLSITILQPSVR
jgi:hypothetical protein